jgi:cytochrome P450
MAHDENVYANPGNFNPTRFLPKPSGNGEPHLNAVFGFGRRLVIRSYLYISYKDWTVLAT